MPRHSPLELAPGGTAAAAVLAANIGVAARARDSVRAPLGLPLEDATAVVVASCEEKTEASAAPRPDAEAKETAGGVTGDGNAGTRAVDAPENKQVDAC